MGSESQMAFWLYFFSSLKMDFIIYWLGDDAYKSFPLGLQQIP